MAKKRPRRNRLRESRTATHTRLNVLALTAVHSIGDVPMLVAIGEQLGDVLDRGSAADDVADAARKVSLGLLLAAAHLADATMHLERLTAALTKHDGEDGLH